MEADGDGNFRRYCYSVTCRRFTTFKKNKEDDSLRCEVCSVRVVRCYCDLCRVVTFFVQKEDGYFYCERCEDEDQILLLESCCSSARTPLKWNKKFNKFYCPQCDSLRPDILRTALDYSSVTYQGLFFIPPTHPSEEVDDFSNLLTPPDEDVDDSFDLPTPSSEEVDDFSFDLPTPSSEEVDDFSNLLTPPDEDVDDSFDLPTPSSEEVDDFSNLLTPPDEEVDDSPDLFTPPNEEVDESPDLPTPPNEEVDDSPDLPTPPDEEVDDPPHPATKKKRGRPNDAIPEFCLKPHYPYGELDPPFQATKSDSGFGPSKPDQGPDEQLPLVRIKQRKRRRR